MFDYLEVEMHVSENLLTFSERNWRLILFTYDVECFLRIFGVTF